MRIAEIFPTLLEGRFNELSMILDGLKTEAMGSIRATVDTRNLAYTLKFTWNDILGFVTFSPDHDFDLVDRPKVFAQKLRASAHSLSPKNPPKNLQDAIRILETNPIRPRALAILTNMSELKVVNANYGDFSFYKNS